MKIAFFSYTALVFWFFFWLVPRVNDGRLEEIIQKFEQRKKQS